MMRALLLAVGIALLLCPGALARCFDIPEGADYAAIVIPTSSLHDVDLAPLFDKSPDPATGTKVDFVRDGEGLKLTFDIPDDMPLLGSLRITGRGTISVQFVWQGYSIPDQEPEECAMDAKSPTCTFTGYPERSIKRVIIKGVAGGAVYVTDLQMLASAERYEVFWDESSWGDYGGSGYDGAWGQDDWTEVAEGCECAYFPAFGEQGYSCGEWDDDCKGHGGWCYVRAGACNDSRTSSSFPSMEWSCTPCGNGSATSTVPKAPLPAKPVKPVKTPAAAAGARRNPAKRPPSVRCGTCLDSMIWATLGGLALSIVLKVIKANMPRRCCGCGNSLLNPPP